MGMPFLLAQASATFTCVHGAGFKIVATSPKAQEASASTTLVPLGSTIAPAAAPCPSTPPSMGLPPCVFPPFIAGSTKKFNVGGLSYAFFPDVQFAATGPPNIPATGLSTKVLTLG